MYIFCIQVCIQGQICGCFHCSDARCQLCCVCELRKEAGICGVKNTYRLSWTTFLKIPLTIVICVVHRTCKKERTASSAIHPSRWGCFSAGDHHMLPITLFLFLSCNIRGCTMMLHNMGGAHSWMQTGLTWCHVVSQCGFRGWGSWGRSKFWLW